MLELGLSVVFDFGNDALGQDIAQLDPPLVRGINVPYGSLGEDAVLV